MNTEAQKPYEWRKVVVWALTLFLLGLTTARSPFGSGPDRFALSLLSGTVWAIIGGLIVAVWKHFKRSSSTISPAELQANDKGLFIVALVLAVFLAGKAIYLETYGALVDAAILIGLGFAVKAGLAPARWAFAIYAFVSPMIVMAGGGGNAVIWPFVFYFVCRSLSNDVGASVEVANNGTLPAASAVLPNNPVRTSPPTTSSPTADFIRQHSTSTQIPVMPAQSSSPSSGFQVPSFDEDAVYEVVANEMESGKMDKGLWTRLFAELDGDEKKTKIAYIKQRAEKLMAAERVRLQEAAHKQAEAAARLEKLRLEGLSIREKLAPANLTPELIETIQQLSNTSNALTFLSNVRLNKIDQVTAQLAENPLYVAMATSEGATALHIAADEKYLSMSRLLIEKGARVDQPNSAGQTPLDIARRSGKQELIDLYSAI